MELREVITTESAGADDELKPLAMLIRGTWRSLDPRPIPEAIGKGLAMGMRRANATTFMECRRFVV